MAKRSRALGARGGEKLLEVSVRLKRCHGRGAATHLGCGLASLASCSCLLPSVPTGLLWRWAASVRHHLALVSLSEARRPREMLCV